ncbi:MAG: glutamine amidotransferase, partial [Dehalococcoidia bacterium]|nr:glutamine amidotransferase [Dehalococcoidia bacterium]
LGPSARPLARVIAGYGNNGRDGGEGAVQEENAFGTYLHGSLLPKNPRFADHLIVQALRRRYGEVELAPLDDALEERAHAEAVRLATRKAIFLKR